MGMMWRGMSCFGNNRVNDGKTCLRQLLSVGLRWLLAWRSLSGSLASSGGRLRSVNAGRALAAPPGYGSNDIVEYKSNRGGELNHNNNKKMQDAGHDNVN